MKKIFNWTFGSVFRTFGRVIAYIIIGTIISIILSNSNFRITDLFFDKVKASTSGRLFVSQLTINGEGVTVPSTGWYVSNNQYYIPMTTQNPNQGNWSKITYQFNELTFPANTKNFVTGLYIHNSDSLTQEYEYTAYSEGYQIYESGKNLYSLSLYYDGNTGFNYCNPIGNNGEFFYFSCPVMTTNFNKLILTIHTNKASYNFASYFTFGLRSAFTLDIEGNNITDLIEAETQNTQDIINQQQNSTQQIIEQQERSSNQTQQTIINSTNQTISTITDDTSPDLNGTLDNNTIAGWLPAGPIDSIVTLPLTLLNSLFNAMGGTCADLVVPLPFVNKNLNIPCMSRVYNDMSFGSFFNWIGVVASAFILYKYLLRLYKWIDATLTLRENTQVDWGGD